MTRYRSLAAIAAAALALAFLPLLPVACSPSAPPAPAVGKPIATSARPIAGHTRAYGWVRPTVKPAASTRYRLKLQQRLMAPALPKSVDLRPKDVPIYDQGQLGSCTANAWAAAVQYHDKNVADLTPALPSRLFIYYGERALEGTTLQDAGAAVADGGKVISTTGVAPETDWPYDPNKYWIKPPWKAYRDAARHVLPAPSSIDTTDLDEVKTAVASGHPVVFGFDVYASFEAQSLPNNVYVPSGQYVGGHCVEVVGYDDATAQFTVRNSWGPYWADHGYFYFPYKYFASTMTSDAWTLAN